MMPVGCDAKDPNPNLSLQRRGGHTCWVLVAGEASGKDMAKGLTKT